MPELKQRPGDQPLPVVNTRPDIQSMVIADIERRRQVGIERYGTALQPFNGRDAVRDAYEEAMDLTMYLRQVLEERDAAVPAPILCGTCRTVPVEQLVVFGEGYGIPHRESLRCGPCAADLVAAVSIVVPGLDPIPVTRFALTPLPEGSPLT